MALLSYILCLFSLESVLIVYFNYAFLHHILNHFVFLNYFLCLCICIATISERDVKIIEKSTVSAA